MADVIMPKMGDAMTEGTLLKWAITDGTQVKAGDIIAEIETDKSNVEVEAEDSGVLKVRIQPGTTVPVGEVIATIGDTASAKAAPANGASAPAPVAVAPAPAKAPEAAPAPAAAPAVPAPSNNGQRLKASPLARRVARDKGVELAQVTGTGPHGRIIEADVRAFAEQKASAPAAKPAAAAPAAPSTPAPSTTPIELSSMRRTIARRMVESKTTIPHFYVTSEIDMTEAIALREKLNSYDESLPKISFNDMVVKAAAKALVKFPGANASFRDGKIYPGAGVHVGIAVALDDGLIVPVVKNTDSAPLRQVARTARELIKKARDKKLQTDEYTGGTFTVSNLGTFDVENFTAIIDPSQGAILAVASIKPKPVVLEDGVTIAVRHRMNVTFSGDHRVMDGAVGAGFLQELKKLLQNPLSLME